MFQVSSLWLSSIISCASKNLSHFLSLVSSAVSQLLTAFSLLLCDNNFSMVLLCPSLQFWLSLFSLPPLHDAERFVYVSGIYRSKTWLPWALFCFLSCFSSVLFTSFLHLTLGLLCSCFFRVLKCQLRLWEISSFPVAIDFILGALFVTICPKTFFTFFYFFSVCLREGSLVAPINVKISLSSICIRPWQKFIMIKIYILFLIHSMHFNHGSCIIFYSC